MATAVPARGEAFKNESIAYRCAVDGHHPELAAIAINFPGARDRDVDLTGIQKPEKTVLGPESAHGLAATPISGNSRSIVIQHAQCLALIPDRVAADHAVGVSHEAA